MLDSGASYHTMPNRNCFSFYEDKEGNSIIMRNGAICKLMGVVPCKFRYLMEWVVLSLMLAMFQGLGSPLSPWDNWILWDARLL